MSPSDLQGAVLDGVGDVSLGHVVAAADLCIVVEVVAIILAVLLGAENRLQEALRAVSGS